MADIDWTDTDAVRERLADAQPVAIFDLGWRSPRPPSADTLSETLHEPDSTSPVKVYIDPDLDALGRQYSLHGYSTTEWFVVLREWHPQVLLHELLHAALGWIPSVPPQGHWFLTPHNVINAVEVALAPFLAFPLAAPKEARP